MALVALIFDFDGLILDTETPEVEVWKAIFAEHGCEYPMEEWSQLIGSWGNDQFDPAAILQERSGKVHDLEALRKRHRAESDALVLRAPVLEGVQDCLDASTRLGLRRAVASSSERAWVEPHLKRLGLLPTFEQVITGDDVAPGRTKPHPDLFLKALDAMRLRPDEALVLEDSPNGVEAAHAAGIRVVAVQNPVTAALPMNAELRLRSMAELPLEEILKRVDEAPPLRMPRKTSPGSGA
jgi:HAD superfamily hydrolase (TIGR01509 family)